MYNAHIIAIIIRTNCRALMHVVRDPNSTLICHTWQEWMWESGHKCHNRHDILATTMWWKSGLILRTAIIYGRLKTCEIYGRLKTCEKPWGAASIGVLAKLLTLKSTKQAGRLGEWSNLVGERQEQLQFVKTITTLASLMLASI